MSLPETIGTIGVALILLAFVLNLMAMLDRRSRAYLTLNLVGGVLACAASVLIGFVPFVVLEGIWSAVALGGLLRLSPVAEE